MATPGSGVPVVKEQLEKGKVVPDVVSGLAPELVDLRVFYNEVEVVNGVALRKAQTQIKPHVELHDPSAVRSAHDLYALLMVDPDAPSPTKPSFRNFLHWLVVNVPGSVAPSQEMWQLGQELVSYMGPAPPEGDHRYVFLLFKQVCKMPVEGLSKDNRKSFDVEAFAKAHKLGHAVGGLYFVASADELGHTGKQV
ncbi:hypothetical protein L7F22_061225 [Adiantum nelumboides]|nr:hypothetical protein [Adiantum nelumboides]